MGTGARAVKSGRAKRYAWIEIAKVSRSDHVVHRQGRVAHVLKHGGADDKLCFVEARDSATIWHSKIVDGSMAVTSVDNQSVGKSAPRIIASPASKGGGPPDHQR